jgi:hypothetical protein
MTGGDALSSALERKFAITLAQAEHLKRKAGFDPSAADGRAFLVMQRPMGEIIEETRRTIAHHERKTGRKVAKILLAGGTALTPGIADYVGTNFPEIEVAVGDPLRGLSLGDEDAAPALAKNAIVYAVAIGLAARAAGVRAGPGIDLTAEDKKRSGVAGALDTARSFIAFLTSMTARPKKSKKPKAPKAAPPPEPPKEAPPAEEPKPAPPPADLPDVLREGAAATPEPPKDEAPEPEPVTEAAEPAPPAEEPKAEGAPKVWVNEPEHEEKEAEEQDFGGGIGDILGSADEIKAPKLDAADLESDGSADDSGKLSIETILSQREGAPQPKKQAKAAAPAPKRAEAPRGARRKPRVSPLVLLVLLLFLASLAGIYMFVQKNGLPQFPDVLSRFGGAPEAEQPQAQPPATEAPDAVSVGVVVAASQQPEGEKPVLLSRVIETDVRKSGSFAATGEATVSGGRAAGFATIINETDRSYTFVATTRLLTPDGVLFRMKSASPIPANGEVRVEVYADEPGPEGDIGPSTFTIPGLPSYLQTQIHARSDEPMTGGSGTAKAITQADIDAAKAALLEDLKKEAEANFSVMMVEGERLHADLVTWQELSAEAPTAGDAADTFSVTMAVRFRARLVPERDILPLLEARLAEAAPEGMLAGLKLGGVLYTVEAFDDAAGKAEIRAEAAVVPAS